jgi:hypothetical protein
LKAKGQILRGLAFFLVHPMDYASLTL